MLVLLVVYTNAQGLIQYVQPLCGTAAATTPSAKKHGEGTELLANTFPAVGVPFGMTQFTPQTRASEKKCLSPYYYKDSLISGFRASHWIGGSCTQDYGSVTIMLLKNELITDPEKRGVTFSHDEETAKPNYYSVVLPSVKIEMTALSHTGMIRFTCKEDGDYFLLVEPNSDRGEGYVHIDPNTREISGYNPAHRIYQGWGEPAGFSGNFCVQVDKTVSNYGCWKGDEILKATEIKGDGKLSGAYVQLSLKKGESVLVKTGMSFSNIAQAKKNLLTEMPGWNIEAVIKKSGQAWNEALPKIAVKGGSEDDRIKFYTALYHSQLLPRVFSDVDGTYPAFSGKGELHKANGFNYYDDYSMWDTYRAVHPLFNIIASKRNSDMVRSLLVKAKQGSWLPIFPCWNNYTAAMIGDHCISMISDAIVKETGGFDTKEAYRVMRKNAFVVNEDYQSYANGKGRRALASYLKYGYIPLEDSVKESFHKNEQVSRTMEYAYDDYALAQVAKKLGYANDYKTLMKRSLNYKNVFDTSIGFVRGKHIDGSWSQSFDAYNRVSWITEGTPFHYTFSAPQDIKGLMSLMGGLKAFVNKLDTFFNKEYYWHGNEHGQHTPYLYVFAGEAYKTQALVRKIVDEEYGTGPGGISGNEDAGQMSAWLVFSMIGFYPVCPGNTSYAIGSPAFDEVIISCAANKKFVIKAINNSPENKFIKKAMLNGKILGDLFLQHKDIVGGGELLLYMSNEPVKNFPK